MRSIDYSTGIWREYAINGDETNTIRVNIADPGILARMDEVVAEAKAWTERLRTDHTPETLAEADEALRVLLDRAFGTPISAKAFGKTSIFTPVNADGTFLLTAFCEAFGAALREDAEAFRAAHTKPDAPRPEVAQYLVAPKDGKPVAAFAHPYGAPLPDVKSLTEEQRRALLAQLLAT